MGEVLHNHIPESVINKKNKNKSWKYGYDESYDIVIISKDGTISQPYRLQNVNICSPAIPDNINTIRNSGLDREDQAWTPYVIPKELLNIEDETVEWNSSRANKDNPKTPSEIFYMKPDSFVKKYEKYINADWDRRDYGEWIYINGKAVWIPPSHYFMLQHSPVQGNRLPDFRFTNLDYWMFWEAVKADIRCLGMIYLKNRRSGASTMAGSEAVNVGTNIEEGFLGIMSKTNRDSVSFLTRMVLRPFKKLAWYFKPLTSGTSSAASGLIFKEPAKKMSSKNTVMSAESGLDTSIKQFPTALNSMDGERVDFMVLDECGKLPSDVPFDQYFSVAEECLVEGFKIIGKCMAVSTCNSQAKGGREFKEVYYASDARKRMENGRTATGMYSLFIPAEWNQEGGYDKFGYSIVDDPTYTIRNREGDYVKKGNLSRLIEKGESLKKQSAALYNEFLRKHPRTEQHAFRDESNDSDFNLNKIYEQMDYNELVPNIHERGNFINKGDEENPVIDWIPDKYRGRFLMRWMPEEKLRNNFERRAGELTPLNDFGMFGVDTYRVQKTVDRRGGSKGAMSGVTDTSMNIAEYPSNFFFLEYLERPATLENFMQDMEYALLFYGTQALIESNVDNLLKHLRRKNMTRFSLRRADKNKLTPDELNYGGIPMTSEKVRNEHYFSIQRYIEQFVGEDDEGLRDGDKKEMGDMGFNRTLDSWSKFAPDNRTSEDLSISSGLALLGLRMKKNKVRPDEHIQDVMTGFYGQQYDYAKSNIGRIK